MEKPAQVCPGESACGKFQIAKSETGDGSDACANCSMLPTKPTEDGTDDEDDEIFDEIKNIVFFENAFPGKTDWSCYDFSYRQLYAAWRDAELKIKTVQETKLQQTLSGLQKTIQAVLRFR